MSRQLKHKDFKKISRTAQHLDGNNSDKKFSFCRKLFLSHKCIPVLFYGLEVCPLNKSQIASLDFVINRFFMKLFNTNNMEIIKAC